MRDAAVSAGLVPNAASARERIEFVSEGEASFHWCVDNGLATSALVVRLFHVIATQSRDSLTNLALQPGATIVVADAGGGTIDVTSFRITSLKPLRLEEAAAAECKPRFVADGARSAYMMQFFRPHGWVGLRDKSLPGYGKRQGATSSPRIGAKRYMLDKLKKSSFGEEDYIERLTEEFDKKTKCLFRDKENPTVMKIGTRKDNDAKHGIKMGHISFPG